MSFVVELLISEENIIVAGTCNSCVVYNFVRVNFDMLLYIYDSMADVSFAFFSKAYHVSFFTFFMITFELNWEKKN